MSFETLTTVDDNYALPRLSYKVDTNMKIRELLKEAIENIESRFGDKYMISETYIARNGSGELQVHYSSTRVYSRMK